MKKYDVLAIGNAIVDILAKVPEKFLTENNLEKGAMKLIDGSESSKLYAALDDKRQVSGGSAANSAYGITELGGKALYVGKVANDELGFFFAEDMRSNGTSFTTLPLKNGAATATSMIAVTPDHERTMNTYLGACQHLTIDDIHEEDVKASWCVFFEGYLWDQPAAKEAVLKAISIAKTTFNTRVAITLSDANCVRRHLEEFQDLISSGKVDIVLANKNELMALYECDAINPALITAANSNALFAVTLGGDGAAVLENGEIELVSADDVTDIVDFTGAGDAFAAGFLASYLGLGSSPFAAAKAGCAYAGQIIQVEGARKPRENSIAPAY